MANYLVTGGAGFIGSNIAEHLVAQGESVRIIDDLSTGRRANVEAFLDRVDFLEGDITGPDACARAVEGMDYVLHQAAIPSVPRSVADPMAGHHANATGTLNLLIAARDAKVKRFVYAGSSSAYGDQPGAFKREDLRPNPTSPYGAAKLAGECYVAAFSACYGIETVSLRYFNVFGPRQDPNSPYSAVIPLFISAVQEGRSPTIYGDGRQSRDFTYVENNVRANILAATGDFDAKGQVYNIACGQSYSVLDLLAGVNAALNAAVEPVFAAPRVGDIRDSRAAISRAQADLGYTVTVPFVEGLKRTVAWYAQTGPK
jgi:UDP-N-acetylglucosamine/UDP-N-acetyl-alpha-D-glucosaminouronate 4-epimerase